MLGKIFNIYKKLPRIFDQRQKNPTTKKLYFLYEKSEMVPNCKIFLYILDIWQ